MSKPSTVLDLVQGGHMTMSEVRVIARQLFDGATTGAGPEGYVITASNYDNLGDHVKQWIDKAILAFAVENVLDAHDGELTDEEMIEASIEDVGAALDSDHSNADSVLAENDPEEG